jgi:hypothetical protein
MGNYYYLTEANNEPHVVANFFKKVLSSMAEPLCTYKLYYKFRDVGELNSQDKKIEKLRELC